MPSLRRPDATAPKKPSKASSHDLEARYKVRSESAQRYAAEEAKAESKIRALKSPMAVAMDGYGTFGGREADKAARRKLIAMADEDSQYARQNMERDKARSLNAYYAKTGQKPPAAKKKGK